MQPRLAPIRECLRKPPRTIMELRHLRYFVAVAESGNFVRAASRVRVAQPALSKQIRDLEREVGVPLFERFARGVRLTPAGEAFLRDARITLEDAQRALASARSAADQTCTLRFAHGDLWAHDRTVERLLAKYRATDPGARVEVLSHADAESYHELRENRVDVACVFMLGDSSLEGFETHRLVDCTVRGVLLPARHPLADRKRLRLADLRSLCWFHSGAQRWPGMSHAMEEELAKRGLVPERRRDRPRGALSTNLLIAAEDAWSVANKEIAARYLQDASAIVYRPFVDPPIPIWLALVWRPDRSAHVARLVESAGRKRSPIKIRLKESTGIAHAQ